MERNARVEADKAWEGSSSRMLSLGAITYLVSFVLLYLIHVENIFFAALVPAAGFILSVQTLPTRRKLLYCTSMSQAPWFKGRT